MDILATLLIFSVLTGCLTSWVVLLLSKWGVLERLQVNGPKLIGKLVSCDFCMNWWLSWAVTLVAFVSTGWWWLLFTPFFSTTIGRILCA